jgi:hypothetical protein
MAANTGPGKVMTPAPIRAVFFGIEGGLGGVRRLHGNRRAHHRPELAHHHIALGLRINFPVQPHYYGVPPRLWTGEGLFSQPATR